MQTMKLTFRDGTFAIAIIDNDTVILGSFSKDGTLQKHTHVSQTAFLITVESMADTIVGIDSLVIG